MSYKETSPLAGRTVKVVKGDFEGEDFVVEDYACNVFGSPSWPLSIGNPAVLEYLRTHEFEPDAQLTALYGKVGMFGHILHADELEGAE